MRHIPLQHANKSKYLLAAHFIDLLNRDLVIYTRWFYSIISILLMLSKRIRLHARDMLQKQKKNLNESMVARELYVFSSPEFSHMLCRIISQCIINTVEFRDLQ